MPISCNAQIRINYLRINYLLEDLPPPYGENVQNGSKLTFPSLNI